MKERTRDGKGVESAGQPAPNPLKPLADSTIRRRKRKKLSNSTSASKSNLTETGQMLDSIQGGVISGEIVVEYSNDQAAKKAGFNRLTRSFEILASSEIKKIIDVINDLFRRS